MTSATDTLFKGKAIIIDTNPSTVKVKCYDPLQKLNGEHIPVNEGLYAGADAGVIIKDIISNSRHSIVAGGDADTGVIVDLIDLTDKTRLMAIKLLLVMINGDPDADQYHIRAKGDEVILETLPDYFNDEPAVSLTDTDLDGLTHHEAGNQYYNCATCVGEDDNGNEIRAFYPATENPNEDLEPDFPDSPVHKLIKDSGLKGIAACYQVARGFVKAHDTIPETISITFTPDRLDYFPGQKVTIDAFKYNVYGDYRIREITGKVSRGGERKMTFKLSSVATDKISTFIKTSS